MGTRFEAESSSGGDEPAVILWKEPAEHLAHRLDADILILNSGMTRPVADQVVEACRVRRRRSNVLLILVTTGGDADAGYKIARALQRYYERFTAYIPGYCKSAGTLVVMGAHDLIFGDHGELGPLDVQMRKPDELWESSSGLTVMEAINTLENTAYRMLETCFLNIKTGSGGQITFKTATEVAVATVTGLLEPIYKQIDPMHVGEAGRAMSIGREYGYRLNAVAGNLQPDALANLAAAFPVHTFVIDREEAASYFERVRAPEADEDALVQALGTGARLPMDEPVWAFLSDEVPVEEVEEVLGDEHQVPGRRVGEGNGRPDAEVARAGQDAGDRGEPVRDEEDG